MYIYTDQSFGCGLDGLRLDSQSQTFLDELGDEALRSLLILHQHLMGRGDLVSVKSV